MILYTITYDKLTLSGDEEIRVRTTIHDLPLQTANMYREKMQGLNFEMRAQTAIVDEPREVRRGRKTRTYTAAPGTPAPKSRTEKINEAAATGDLTAAINER